VDRSPVAQMELLKEKIIRNFPCNPVFINFCTVPVKMFTKVICKKMVFSSLLQRWLHSKLDLFREEKWKTFISFLGKVVTIFSVPVLFKTIWNRSAESVEAFLLLTDSLNG
jgi:hypothetical protein